MNLERGDPKELCRDFIKENPNTISEENSISVIMNSGYAGLLKNLVEWHFMRESNRNFCYVIHGETATGKS